MGCNVGIPPCAAIAPAVERTLGKGEVVSSNLTSSTIPLKILSFIFRTLRRFFVQKLSCIFAVILVLWCIGYALQMQFMAINTHVPTQSRHTEEGESV